MPRVSFTANLERHLACPVAQVEGDTVRAALERVFARNPALRSYLLDDQDRLRTHVAIFVNDQKVADRIGLSDPVAPDDEIFAFQALSGGCDV